MDKVRWLLVGAGDISRKRVAPALSEASNSQIVAMCTRRREPLNSLADVYQVKERYTDFDEALEKTSPVMNDANDRLSMGESRNRKNDTISFISGCCLISSVRSDTTGTSA